MAFKPEQFFIEDWLTLERDNLLQKVCNTFNADGQVTQQWKTRITVVPSGQIIQMGSGVGRQQANAAALYRAFSYDEAGNRIASLPEIREWEQGCEDRAQGADDEPLNPFVGSGGTGGLPFNWDAFTIDRTAPLEDVYNYTLASDPTGTVTIVYAATDKCDLAGGSIVVL